MATVAITARAVFVCQVALNHPTHAQMTVVPVVVEAVVADHPHLM